MEKIEVKCSACNKKFKALLFRYKYKKNRGGKFWFCSKLCKGELFRLSGYRKPTTWIKLSCFNCKKNFRITKTIYSQKIYRKTIKTYCSSKCKNYIQKLGGKLSPRWNGGRYRLPSYGNYIMINLGANKRMLEHRYLMQKHIGRKLKPKEVVHHLNQDPSDNRIENLVLCSSAGQHTSKYHPRNINKKGQFKKIK